MGARLNSLNGVDVADTEPVLRDGPTPESLFRRTHSDSAESVFTWRARPLEESIMDISSWVALDTNVLLTPYAVGGASLAAIVNVLTGLSTQSRLVIAGQVAREFARNRPTKLGELLQGLSDTRSKVTTPPQVNNYPLLANNGQYDLAREAWKSARAAVAEYQAALDSLRKDVGRLLVDDPILEAFSHIFKGSVVIDPSFDEDTIQTEAKHRKSRSIPPGYKDAARDDGGFGDLLIWKTLLGLARSSGRDLIIVTEEKKTDWWHQSGGGPFYPRYELVDEYRRTSGGGTLHLIELSTLLRELSASASAVDEVLRHEARRPAVTDTARGAILVADEQTLLIRGEEGYAAVRPISQSSVSPAPSTVHYIAWSSGDTQDFSAGLADEQHGHTSEGNGLPTAVVNAGPYEVPWSAAGPGEGWFYYREHNMGRPGRLTYELALASPGEVNWNEFRDGVFRRGDGEIN